MEENPRINRRDFLRITGVIGASVTASVVLGNPFNSLVDVEAGGLSTAQFPAMGIYKHKPFDNAHNPLLSLRLLKEYSNRIESIEDFLTVAVNTISPYAKKSVSDLVVINSSDKSISAGAVVFGPWQPHFRFRIDPNVFGDGKSITYMPGAPKPSLSFFIKEGGLIHEALHACSPLSPFGQRSPLLTNGVGFNILTDISNRFSSDKELLSGLNDMLVGYSRRENRNIWSGMGSTVKPIGELSKLIQDNQEAREILYQYYPEVMEDQGFLKYPENVRQREVATLSGLGGWHAIREMYSKGQANMLSPSFKQKADVIIARFLDEAIAHSVELEWREYEPFRQERKFFVEQGLRMLGNSKKEGVHEIKEKASSVAREYFEKYKNDIKPHIHPIDYQEVESFLTGRR